MIKTPEPVDAECQSRNKHTDAATHLQHLLKIGHAPNSFVIKSFCAQHGLERPAK